MKLTNGDLGDIVDAIKDAIEFRLMIIDSELPPPGRWSKKDRENFADWNGQVKRWRRLRRYLLAEEKFL